MSTVLFCELTAADFKQSLLEVRPTNGWDRSGSLGHPS